MQILLNALCYLYFNVNILKLYILQNEKEIGEKKTFMAINEVVLNESKYQH